MKKNFVFNDTTNKNAPIIICDELVKPFPCKLDDLCAIEFKNVTVMCRKLTGVEHIPGSTITQIESEGIDFLYTLREKEVINDFLQKYGVAKKDIKTLLFSKSKFTDKKLEILVKESETPKITEPLKLYIEDANSETIKYGYRYEFEHLNVYPVSLPYFKATEKMTMEK